MGIRSVPVALVVLALVSPLMAENWPGYEGGNLHHNASPAEVTPGTLGLLWDRAFRDPIYCNTTNPGYNGSRNLVCFENYIAVVAADGASFPGSRAYVTILDATAGTTLNCISTTQHVGPARDQFAWPSNVMEAYDTGIGIAVTHWDPATRILFLRNGGDHCNATAYLPLDNEETYTSGGWQGGVAAYAWIYNDHPGFADCIGATRDDKDTPMYDCGYLMEDHWDYGKTSSYNNVPNASAFFEVDAATGMIASANSGGHTQAGLFYLADKYTGQLGQYNANHNGGAAYLVTPPDYSPALTNQRVNAFLKWGAVMVNGDRVYWIGPGDNYSGDGDLGNSSFTTGIPDQGLYVCCATVAWSDVQNNDGYTGPGAAESAALSKAFSYRFISPDVPSGYADAGSYLEVDATYRNKAWLIDEEDDGVWTVWKPTQSGPAQLLHCNDSLFTLYDLTGAGEGLRGQDMWPHMSMQEIGTDKYIVYFYGNGLYQSGSWSSVIEPPLGPAKIAVYKDGGSPSHWVYDVSGNHSSFVPNEALGYFDRSQMVVAGKYAYVGWVDLDQTNATLRLLAFDITSPTTPVPTEFTYDLGIASASNSETCLFDLIAVNGRLYALITESDTLDTRDHTWTGQRVIALGDPGGSTMDIQLSVTPDTGPVRLVAVCDGSGSTSSAPGALTYEWDLSYDHLAFDVDATGVVTTAVFDTEGEHTVGLRVTDSTGRSEVRSAIVEVTADVAANQSTIYPVTEECEINSGANVWAGVPKGYMRCSGTYGGAYGTGEHSRGYVNFGAVSLDAAYTLVEARLHFNLTLINNTGPSTVHRMDPGDTITQSSTWADISSMTGVDQDPMTSGVVEPLDTRFINIAGPMYFTVTDGVEAWLGRGAYMGSPEAQTGFLLCVDDNATPGTLDTGSFYLGEKDHFQWNWVDSQCYLEVIWVDPAASTPETLSGVRPGSTAGESYEDGTPIDVFWGSSGPVDFVDIQYSTTSGSGPWTTIASNQANDGHYSWASPVVGSNVWIRIIKNGDASVNAVSANPFEVTSSVPTYTLSGTVSLSGDLTGTGGVTLNLREGPTLVDSLVLDGSGDYAFTGLPAGTYSYELILSGYSFSITSPAGNTVSVSGNTVQDVGASAADIVSPTVALAYVSLNGTVNDDHSVPTEVLVNGVPYSVTGLNWSSADIAVTGDPFSVTVEASDASSNTTVVVVTIDQQ